MRKLIKSDLIKSYRVNSFYVDRNVDTKKRSSRVKHWEVLRNGQPISMFPSKAKAIKFIYSEAERGWV